MRILDQLIAVISGTLTLFAGPYRAVAYKLRSFGGLGGGLLTWVGILLIYPLCVVCSPFRDRANFGELVLWLALVLIAWVQMFAKWCGGSTRDARDRHFWFGQGEPAFAFALGLLAWILGSPGSGVFFFIGYACSEAQLQLVRLRERLGVWTPSDTARLASPFKAWASSLRTAMPALALAVLSYSQPMIPIAVRIGRGAWSLLQRFATPSPVAAGAGGGAQYRPPTFMGRVGSYVVGHMVISAITGVIGFNIVAIPFAAILWLLGWQVSAPAPVREQGRAVMSRIRDGLDDKKERAIERIDYERDRVVDRLRGNDQ